MSLSPVLVWLRRDLRLSDHPALSAAADSGRPGIPVFIHDDQVAALGAAPKWRLEQGLAHFSTRLEAQDSRLILRRGVALEELRNLLAETGAGALYWTRAYDPATMERDAEIKSSLKGAGIEVRSFGGHLMFEPWTVETKTGGMYRVFTPFWNAVKSRDVAAPLPAPDRLRAPDAWPNSERLEDWSMGAAMNRGAAVVRPFLQLGEAAAQARLATFIEEIVADYATTRDLPGQDGTSNLSENLSLGEISPHQCWHAGLRARAEGARGAETFLRELVWREFAYHLMYHTPHILERNWKEDWDGFGWREDADHPDVRAWQQGRTGIPFVDAAMREMYVTGRMHNRGRMIAGSYLTKHLLTHWRIGMRWFDECLTDWDPASNAMGWQWVAGSGPDASPYFRIFNPVTQLEKFDPDGIYAKRWIAEGQAAPPETALAYFDAVPRGWKLSPDAPYPAPVVELDTGRKRALAAYENRGF